MRKRKKKKKEKKREREREIERESNRSVIYSWILMSSENHGVAEGEQIHHQKLYQGEQILLYITSSETVSG